MNFEFSTVFLASSLCSLIVLLLFAYFKYSYSYWKRRGIFYLEPSFPFGNIWDGLLQKSNGGIMFGDLYKQMEGHKFGGIYSINRPTLIFRDPDLIKDVLIKNFSHFHDHGTYFNEKKDPLMAHLFMLTGNRWKSLRNKLSPIFTSGKMKMMFQIVLDSGKELVAYLEKPASRGDLIEFKDIMARYNTDIIASVAFGIQGNCIRDSDAEFREWGKKIFQPSLKTGIRDIIMFVSPTLSAILNIPFIPEDVTNYFRNMIRETVDYREKNNVNRNDFLNLLIQLKNKEKSEANGEVNEKANKLSSGNEVTLTLDELAAQALVFFIGGFETSSTVLSMCMYELAIRPEIQVRLQSEIDETLLKHNGEITYDAIQQMDYLEKTVSEALRKYPPAPFLVRICTKPYKIPGTDIEVQEGTQAIIPILGLHYDSKHFPDPERFDPERFSDEEKAKRHNFVHLPFGEGPRICIGMRFAQLQIKVGLVSLLSKYSVQVCEKTTIPLKFDPKCFPLSALGGVWLKICKRN